MVVYISAVNTKQWILSGNAKNEKIQKRFISVVLFVIQKATERHKEPPAEVHSDINKNAHQEITIQAVEGTNEQVENARKSARWAAMISQDAQYIACEEGKNLQFT